MNQIEGGPNTYKIREQTIHYPVSTCKVQQGFGQIKRGTDGLTGSSPTHQGHKIWVKQILQQ